MRNLIIYLFIVVGYSNSPTFAWNNDDLEIFDLVEEIDKNFYEVLNIKQDATQTEIKRAFRGLSIILHPDKNSAADADVQFRNLVSVYEVLKDAAKRQIYDDVLKNGLPNWKSALYYYRHYRKMGLAEMAALLFTILTVGQYIVAWAAYVEKKYTAESLLGPKLKKLQKKNKNVDLDQILNSIPTPSLLNLLPFQIVRGVWNSPKAVAAAYHEWADYKKIQEEERQRELAEIAEQKKLEEEFIKQKEARKEGLRNRKPVFTAQEKSEEELKGYSKLKLAAGGGASIRAVESKETTLSGGFWTDEDLAELTRLVKKYPNGTISRWEIIGQQMNRSVQEVTFMAAKMKESGYAYRAAAEPESVAEAIVHDATKKKKPTPVKAPDSVWSQDQQKQLENAIVQYTKSTAGDRWQKIANTVPGKTKEECLARYKYLVEIVKAQKAANETSKAEEEVVDGVDAEPDAREQEPTDEPNAIEGEEKEAEEQEQEAEEENIAPVSQKGGKPRNKRKLRKQQIDYCYDDEDDE